MAEVTALADRVDIIDARVTLLETVPEPEPIVEVLPEEPVTPDEPPATRRSKFNDFWFGKAK